MTAGVTIQQARCLEAIKLLIQSKGRSPSYAEIGLAISAPSMSTVTRLVYALRERGAITFIEGKARTIQIVEGPTREAMLAWSSEEFERVAADVRSITYERQIAKGIQRADFLAEGRA